jgi:Ca-activated chloride channel family protein
MHSSGPSGWTAALQCRHPEDPIRCWLPVVLGVVFFAGASLAAEDQAQAVFPSALDVVNVTVTVRDEKGRLVPDLGVEDFRLYEDGRPQRIALFARSVEPGEQESLTLDLGMLFDTSESMVNVLRFSQQAAIRFLDSIPRARDLLTIFFDQDIRVSRYDSELQQGLIERILDSKGAGRTALYDSIAVYLSRVGESSGRKVLVVFSDGEDSTSVLTMGEVGELVRSSRVTIYPISFVGTLPAGSARALTARAFLLSLADRSGGTYFQPGSARDLPLIYQRILDELSAQYVLGFVSDNAKRDGRYRKLRVEPPREGLKVRCREGYVAPGPELAADGAGTR